MYISKISLRNYRNFINEKVILNPGVNTIIGENGSGKTNFFRAIRLILDDNFYGKKFNFSKEDFCRNIDKWQGHWISIQIEFSDVTSDEAIQALITHHAQQLENNSEELSVPAVATYNLIFRPKNEILTKFSQISDGDFEALNNLRDSITLNDYETVSFAKTSIDLSDQDSYVKIVGDFENCVFPASQSEVYSDPPELGIKVSKYFSISREFSLTYIDALRDVQREFRNKRVNPLFSLLKIKSEQIDSEDFSSVIESIVNVNQEIQRLKDVIEIKDGVKSTFLDTVGSTYSPTDINIKSELPVEASEIFKSLNLYLSEHGELFEEPIEELSLGSANLLYLTLKILEFQYKRNTNPIINILLIEEPEAHLHTHVQKTLFDQIQYEDTQIIYSTHSTNISSMSDVDKVNIISRNDSKWNISYPAKDMQYEDLQSTKRFLDAIRSNVLFSRSVVLVEGDAEEILIPYLIKTIYGISVDELGISIINMRSTGFDVLARLFGSKRITKNCAILTDFDQSYEFNFDLENNYDSLSQSFRGQKSDQANAFFAAKNGFDRRKKLDSRYSDNRYVEIFYAQNTFEVQFAYIPENIQFITDSVDLIYKKQDLIKSIKSDLTSEDNKLIAEKVLRLANKSGKGWYALMLSNLVNSSARIPEYIIKALIYCSNPRDMQRDTIQKIINYRKKEGKIIVTSAEDKLVQDFVDKKIDYELFIENFIDNCTDLALKDLLR